jgi:hypothetical protein
MVIFHVLFLLAYLAVILSALRYVVSWYWVRHSLQEYAMCSYVYASKSALEQDPLYSHLATVALASDSEPQMIRTHLAQALEERMTGTKPGQVTFDRDFVSSTIVHGVIPLAALVAVRFPSVGMVMTSWLDPMVRVFQH